MKSSKSIHRFKGIILSKPCGSHNLYRLAFIKVKLMPFKLYTLVFFANDNSISIFCYWLIVGMWPKFIDIEISSKLNIGPFEASQHPVNPISILIEKCPLNYIRVYGFHETKSNNIAFLCFTLQTIQKIFLLLFL